MRVFNIGQLLTMRDGLGLLEKAWLEFHHGRITALGLMSEHPSIEDDDIDAQGHVVLPGYVDCHTHLANAGGLHDTFHGRCQRLEQISDQDLAARIDQQLTSMRNLGTTTVEIKTGYATTTEAIHKSLAAIPNRRGIVRTEMSPLANASAPHWTLAHQPTFIDALCDPDGLSVEQLREPLHTMRAMQARIKLHTGVTANSRGVPLALELEATSVDHLLHISQHDIDQLSRSSTIAVLLPAMPYYTRADRFAPAQALLDAGATIAIATDSNPGDSPTLSMPFVIHLAVREMHLTPEQALQSATIYAARAIDQHHRAGSLEIGKDADLQILITNDYRDIPAVMGTNLIQQVIHQGIPQ
jgi:imidazolonepropionase